LAPHSRRTFLKASHVAATAATAQVQSVARIERSRGKKSSAGRRSRDAQVNGGNSKLMARAAVTLLDALQELFQPRVRRRAATARRAALHGLMGDTAVIPAELAIESAKPRITTATDWTCALRPWRRPCRGF